MNNWRRACAPLSLLSLLLCNNMTSRKQMGMNSSLSTISSGYKHNNKHKQA